MPNWQRMESVLRANPAAVAQAATSLGYHAVEQTGRRKAPPATLLTEDRTLTSAGRRKLIAQSRDIGRNFTIAAWMVRKHIDYVCEAGFHCRTGDDAFDAECEKFVSWWSSPANFDVSGRFSLDKFVRLAEARKLYDGDFGVLKLASGQVQGIEGDRIRQPTGDTLKTRDDSMWVEGVKILKNGGRPLAYAVHRRGENGSGFTLDRLVSVANLYLYACFDRIDQTRGISPLAAALNQLIDVYENFDLALAKAKLANLFALVFFRDSTGEEDDDQAAVPDGAGGYEVAFGKGPLKLDLDPGDDAKFLESNTPSTQFQEFTQLVVMVGMKALDLPYSFFDESHTNFFGSRGGWMNYDRSCIDKRRDSLALRYHLTRWRLQLAIQDGWLTLPKRGQGLPPWNLGTLPIEWVPTGMPWWDPAKEITGDLKAIGAGLDNPQRICKERGRGDFYENVDATAEAIKYAQGKGVALSFAPGPEPMQLEVSNAP